MRAYLLALALATAAVTAAIAAVNYLVDPFLLNGRVLRAGVNLDKQDMVRYVRLAKANRVADIEPAAVAMGSSRVDHGIDMAAPGWPAAIGPRFNLGIPGSGVDAIHAFFRHAAAAGRLRLVVLGLEFNMFNTRVTSLDGDRDFDVDVLRTPERTAWPWMARALAEAYISLDTLQASVRTLRSQGQGRNEYDLSGRFTEGFYRRRVRCEGGFRAVFAKVESAFMRSMRAADGRADLSWQYRDGRSSFEVFAALLREARRLRIDLRLYISPGHLEEMRMQRVMGLDAAVVEWKRRLVDIVAAESRESGQPAFPLWDFSHVAGVVDEPVPPLDEVAATMRWYWDHSHFSRPTGDRILARVLEHPSGTEDIGFGLRLTTGNIEQVLAEDARWSERAAVDPIALGPDMDRVRARPSGCADR